MEQETKKCPYCGEEILAVAKKCKHCGEWLDEVEVENEEFEEEVDDEEYDETEEDPSDIQDQSTAKNYRLDIIIEVVGVLILLAVAFFTCPSKEKQKERMMEELRVEMRKELIHKHKAIPKSEEKLDKMIEKRWEISITNYGILSIGRLEELETGDNSFFSIGGLGMVYVRDLVLF